VNITEFLEARIAEDEERARDVQEYGDTGGVFSPARVLVECAAKREVLKWVTDFTVLEALAAVYRDHPDHDPNWALADS